MKLNLFAVLLLVVGTHAAEHLPFTPGDRLTRIGAFTGPLPRSLVNTPSPQEVKAANDAEAARRLARSIAARPSPAQAEAKLIASLRLQAATGDRDAIHRLAVRYRHGLGLPRDLPEAKRLFSAAAALGHPTANADLTRLP